MTYLGAHFNPKKLTHGAPDDEIRHAGDLGNIVANAAGNSMPPFPLISLCFRMLYKPIYVSFQSFFKYRGCRCNNCGQSGALCVFDIIVFQYAL